SSKTAFLAASSMSGGTTAGCNAGSGVKPFTPGLFFMPPSFTTFGLKQLVSQPCRLSPGKKVGLAVQCAHQVQDVSSIQGGGAAPALLSLDNPHLAVPALFLSGHVRLHRVGADRAVHACP